MRGDCCATCNVVTRPFGKHIITSQANRYRWRHDDLSAHIGSLPDGRLIGLTKRGWFHVQRLRLNRAQLIGLRLQRAEEQRMRQTLEHNQRANARLREYVRELEQGTERLLQIIAGLTGE